MNTAAYLIKEGQKVFLADFDPADTGHFKSKEEALTKLGADIEKMISLQDRFYARNTYSLLIILQGMDCAGKDSLIKHVLSGLNPQGVEVYSFKKPTVEELEHDFLWRCWKRLPAKGHIGIFNRSYYEELLVTRVHPELLEKERLPQQTFDEKFWEKRFSAINHFEQFLVENGLLIIKFFLHLSKKEQDKRLAERIERDDKQWKISFSDLMERKKWHEYISAYEKLLVETSTKHCPWYIIPADHKWYSQLLAASIIVEKMEALQLDYPKLNEEEKEKLKALFYD
ncbi:polyphosphate--nucleotide phosphotransferase [Candidatus Methylacidiphilum fumarolicum]|uniref:Polyphosphate kinase-2-related domain-containing protein n=2 Tax=Candidatus Methylacidiphilum fumarolicum TaxID=591154 RepID=I0JX39_METFB|nr:PPK2 family polyphosphate kinase [Candidatus Methylacidiphilum fumarolicum]MBW6414495.1 polyphosphate kinase 2 family protein [Candidatus Methylacidiphilum fumarolicum]TFE67292.1 polyphosphate--nucleotide phosphotransferase [Candidatus Methylacidiphilum fumarolicum]TFE72403.1 polyphosphate--nucleotide phosphotransferase [Candidatus Methylacidiphilum fumarolicum]TFE75840.1 polyphosphate--nucleotide phosphotransferase [Candidatus Methylacidiphilum fumarolicum]TFE77772.1 polyphosphate--nucleot